MAASRIRTGVIFILLGGILLLNTTGLMDLSIWEGLLVLWPLLLIAIGIEKIFSATRTLKPLAYLSPVIIVATVGYAVIGASDGMTLGTVSIDRDSEGESFEWSVPLDSGIERIKLDLEFGGGRLKIRGGAKEGELLAGQFHCRYRRPVTEADRSGNVMDVVIHPQGKKYRSERGRHRESWILRLSETVPVDLTLDAGGAKVRLDLEEVTMDRLDLSTGAADIDLIIGSKSPEVFCDIDCGAAAIDITVPAGAGIRLEKETALSAFSTGSLDLVSRGSMLETPDFDNRPVRVTMRISAGVSTLRIRESDDQGDDITI